ncbi:hypothetical protein SLEP1_g14671 [Rubroshorea leprosula]|uniref:Uncharacterized protein n=1 Tax=Rubroshorea leprosula TaxID=152421 RepID=A0AAV5IJU7_9ROSI|nr:hypothetical protein SLEP1_g14671 [Rubroshorea leprosula]
MLIQSRILYLTRRRYSIVSHTVLEMTCFVSQPLPETPSPPLISSGGFSEFSLKQNGKDLGGDFGGSDGPILPPSSQMESNEGFALREWRR